jgi:hypothetical protein
MGAVNLSEPWPIKNAIACLKEVRERESDQTEHGKTVQASMNYAIEVVKGINSMKEPEPPDPQLIAKMAVREFCRGLADQFELLGQRFAAIADGDGEPFGDFGL